ncbi:MAG: hypothetical protein JSS56_05910 [Proteobacteria bacterium]|nr:hypothetical protein [Pseudomonadota bacterium]
MATSRRPVGVRFAFVTVVAASLVTGIAGGLVRAGVGVPASSAWMGQAVAGHAFLMICTFLGTVIGLERAVALRHRAAFAGPMASGLAGIAALAGAPTAAAWLVVAAALAFVAVNAAIVRRQRAAHTVLLLVGALAWLAGTALHALGGPSGAVVPWWFAFLVLTIAAERLEMTRLTRRRAGASHMLYSILFAMLSGAAISALFPLWGGVVFGASLVALAAWLLMFDIARRTVRASGLTRYMAICLLLGYAWLAIAGGAWIASTCGLPLRDAALHGLALGFVFSMMLGHAPVILPAIARVKVLFGATYYVPLVLLHASLVVRLAGGHLGSVALNLGAAGNALAIVAFAITVGGSALAWRSKTKARQAEHPQGVRRGDRVKGVGGVRGVRGVRDARGTRREQ